MRLAKSIIILLLSFLGLLLMSCPNLSSSDDPANIAGANAISGSIKIAGVPVSGVTVTVGSVSATSDANGDYTLAGLASGDYAVTPELSGYGFNPGTRSVTIAAAASTGIDFEAQPGLPIPASYSQNLPAQTSPILVAATPLTVSFTPTVTGAMMAIVGDTTIINQRPGDYTSYSWHSITHPHVNNTPYRANCDGYGYGTAQRVTLVNSDGAIVAVPTIHPHYYVADSGSPWDDCEIKLDVNVDIAPITEKPLLEMTAYWKLLKVYRFAAGISQTITQEYSYGVTETQTKTFTSTVNAAAGIDIEGISSTIGFTYTSEASNSLSIAATTTTTTSLSVTTPSDKEGVYAVWQLVYQLHIVRKATDAEVAAGKDQFGNAVDKFGYVVFSDSRFIVPKNRQLDLGIYGGFDAADMAPVDIYQQNDIVPKMTYFPAGS